MPGTSNRNALEQKANELAQFIYEFQTTKAKSPSHQEMCKALHISTETLGAALNFLESEGRIRRQRGRWRQVWSVTKKRRA